MMNRKGLVYFEDALAGVLEETDDGYQFTYHTEYLEKEGAMPVSLTLPLSGRKFTSNVLFSFFDGLIPEGWLLDLAITHWKVKGNDRFALLLATCRDAIGAVSVIPQID